MARRQRVDRARNMRQRQVEPGARDQLEGGQLVGGGGARMREKVHRVLDPAEAEKGGFDLARLREELDRCRR